MIVRFAVLFFIFLIGFFTMISGFEGIVFINEQTETLSDYVLSDNEISININGSDCYIDEPIIIEENISFLFENKICKRLLLGENSYIEILGNASFYNIDVVGYDAFIKKPLEISTKTYNKKRPYIKIGNLNNDLISIEIINSTFSYLGFEDDTGGKWGFSLYNVGIGLIQNSSFNNNYFGIYTRNTKNLMIVNSNIFDNLEYGLDFHENSFNFIIENNIVRNNLHHGIIITNYSSNNTIRNNLVENHNRNAFVKGEFVDFKTHGIMVHEKSNNNSIINNTLINNANGIYIHTGSLNLIKDNKILNDIENGIYLHMSNNNTIINNSVISSRRYGIYSYLSEDNFYSENYFEKGSYFKIMINDKIGSYYFKSYNLSNEAVDSLSFLDLKKSFYEKIFYYKLQLYTLIIILVILVILIEIIIVRRKK